MTARFPLQAFIPYFTDVDPTANKPVVTLEEAVTEEDNLTSPVAASKPAALSEVDCLHSISIAGMLHIISGATYGLRHALKAWDWALTGLKGLCSFLSSRGTNKKLIQRCYNGRGAIGQAILISIRNFDHYIFEER